MNDIIDNKVKLVPCEKSDKPPKRIAKGRKKKEVIVPSFYRDDTPITISFN